jgi:hypothetical protein
MKNRTATVLGCLVGCALIWMSGCGRNEEESAFKQPATPEQAATVLDLSTFPLMKDAKPGAPAVASFSCEAKGDVKSVFDFHRKQLTSQGWKELPNSSVTDQTASAMFGRKGFLVSLGVYPHEKNSMAVFIQNQGNVKPAKLPVPPKVKPVYVGDASAMYVTEVGVAETKDACGKLLVADGWTPYGAAGDTVDYKQNAILLSANVSSAPAQGGKTMITYSTILMSADLPAPPDADDLRYSEQTRELSFETAADKNAVVDFYKKTLAANKWQPTLEHTVQIDDKDEMIFRNPAKDMVTLTMPPARGGKLNVSLQHQSAAEIAELDRQIKEHEPEIKAKIAKQREEENARWDAEHGVSHSAAAKALPKFAVTLPAGIDGLEIKNDEIKLTVAHGKAKEIAQAWKQQFTDAGWKVDAAALDTQAGAISFSKDTQSLTINYTDIGVMPTEVTLSAIGVELVKQ